MKMTLDYKNKLIRLARGLKAVADGILDSGRLDDKELIVLKSEIYYLVGFIEALEEDKMGL